MTEGACVKPPGLLEAAQRCARNAAGFLIAPSVSEFAAPASGLRTLGANGTYLGVKRAVSATPCVQE